MMVVVVALQATDEDTHAQLGIMPTSGALQVVTRNTPSHQKIRPEI